MNGLRIFLLSFFCLVFSAQAAQVDLKNAPLSEFIAFSKPLLPYNITYTDALADKVISVHGVVTDSKYPAFFDSVLRSNGLVLVPYGSLFSVQSLVVKPGMPVIKTYNLKNAQASVIAADVEKMLSTLEGGYSVTASTVSNSLTVSMPFDYVPSVSDYVRSLDVVRHQVLIQAAIVETGVDGLKKFGFDFDYKSGDVDFGFSNGTPFDGSLSFGVLSPRVKLDFDALESDNAVDLLSAPTSLVVDRETASMSVGQEVPFITGSVRQEDGSIYQTIIRQPVGLSLSVTPFVLNRDNIMLRVKQVVSGVDGDTEAADIVTTQRFLETTLTLASGKTVLIGGLIRNDVQETVQSVPFLSSIPGIGKAFTYNKTEETKRQLSIILKASLL